MPRQIDESTLAAIGGRTTGDAAKSFADTMMNLYAVKKNAEMQDMQMNAMKQQQQEWEANRELRSKERQMSLQKIDAEMQLLPLQLKNETQAAINQSVSLKMDALDNAFTQYGTVKGAKSHRIWLENNKEVLKDFFDSEDQYSEFVKQPYSVEKQQAVLKQWRLNKPEMMDKLLLIDAEAKLAAAKSKTESLKLSVPSPTAIADTLSDMGVDADLRQAGSMVVRDLMDLSRNNQIPIPLGSTEAIRLVKKWSDEIDDAYWFKPDNVAADYQLKMQQFVNDMQNNRGDAYVSMLTGVPVAAIEELKKNNPDYTEQEIYGMLFGRAVQQSKSGQDVGE